MIEPRLADRCKFPPEPPGNDVEGDPAVAELIDRRDLFGGERRFPRSRQDRRDDLHFFGRSEERMTERDKFMLVFGAVSRGKADLAQGVLEPGLLGDLRELDVIIDIPAGALLDVADH